MRNIIVSIFLVLTFLCSPAMSETAADWFNKALALWDERIYIDPKKAIAYLKNAIRLKPDYADAYYLRGFAYDDLENHQRAIKDYSEAIRLSPDDAIAYNNRGICLFIAGQ